MNPNIKFIAKNWSDLRNFYSKVIFFNFAANAASHQSLHCLPPIQLFLDTTVGSKLYLFKF